MDKYGTDVLVLRGKKIPVELADLPQANLHFYIENPRLYSLVRKEGHNPTQEEIEEQLSRMDNVKELVNSIKTNGGLMDAIIVQGGTNVVLEGNRRLAAYRILAKQDPIKWGKIKSKVLPKSIGESEIFSLLGEYHIVGKQDWAPYEQAGYIYRRHKTHKVSIPDLCKEINMGSGIIGDYIDTYQFMIDHDEHDVSRWSYFYEYIKSNIIKKARDKYHKLDTLVVKKIRSGEIPTAMELRDKLKIIAEAGGKVLERFSEGKRSFEDSVEAAIHKGAGDHSIKKLKKFKEWIGTGDAQYEISSHEGEAKKETIFELKKIEAIVSRLLKKLTK